MKRDVSECKGVDDSPFPIPHQLRTYLIDGPCLNQNPYKDIRLSYSLKYKHSKKQISLRKNKW